MRMTELSCRYDDVLSLFGAAFGHEPTLGVAAPGRVNLMGGHTDYNQGFVLPVAIDLHVVMAAAPRRDRRVLLHASNLGAHTEFSLEDVNRDQEQRWSNYQRGVAVLLQEMGYSLAGMEAVIWGDVPIGSGLGSSAAAEVATAYAFQQLNELEIDRVELALLCQRAESEFVGVECGVMDQLIAVMAKRGHALFIDCQGLATEHVRLQPEVSIVVADTMERRDLVRSGYNLRREECRQGAELLGVNSLREVTAKEFAAREEKLPSPLRERCRHVIRENQRVVDGVGALKREDVEEFGRLMGESHRSLRDDYGVSSQHLDLLVETASRVDGVYGSRLTGAGFGGCTVSLVVADAVEDFKAHVSSRYEDATGIVPEIYVCRAEDGVSYQVLSQGR